MPTYDAPLLRLAQEFRTDLLAREEYASRQMVERWGQAWQRIARDLAALSDAIQRRRAAGEAITRGQLWRQERYQDLLRQIEVEIQRLLPYAESTISKAQEATLDMAVRDARALTEASLNLPAVSSRILASWNTVSPEAMTALVGTLQTGSPLRSLLDQLGTQTSLGIQERLTSGLAAGRNPRYIARAIRNEFGMGLTRALRISRTEILRSYRSASLMQYRANPQMVKGWRWTASMSSRTCIACLIQHGKVFPVDTPMASHVQCRCEPIPVTLSWRELGIDLDEPAPVIQEGDGWRWFTSLSDHEQAHILGVPMFNAWKQGLIGPDQMWHVHHDATWGDSIVASSVKMALGKPDRWVGV